MKHSTQDTINQTELSKIKSFALTTKDYYIDQYKTKLSKELFNCKSTFFITFTGDTLVKHFLSSPYRQKLLVTDVLGKQIYAGSAFEFHPAPSQHQKFTFHDFKAHVSFTFNAELLWLTISASTTSSFQINLGLQDVVNDFYKFIVNHYPGSNELLSSFEARVLSKTFVLDYLLSLDFEELTKWCDVQLTQFIADLTSAYCSE